MNKFAQLARILSHPRELRLALSGLGVRLSGDDRFGGLAADEIEGLCRWVGASRPAAFVEIGTLFGFTARRIAALGVRTVAVDNFSWNPFGLSPDEHAAFTRRVLESTAVELVDADAAEYLASDRLPSAAFVFLDGDHRYEAVKAEIDLCLKAGVKFLAGHDYGNRSFGVARAVDEAFGRPDETAGTCWLKRL